MPRAGNINVGINVDAGDLGVKLAAAIRSKLAPVLAELQTNLSATNASLGRTARGFDALARAARNAADQMKRTAAVARIYSHEYDVAERQRATATENAARRITAANARIAASSKLANVAQSRGPAFNLPGGGGKSSQDYGGILGLVHLRWDRFLSGLIFAGGAIGTLLPLVGMLGGAIGVLGGGIGVAVGGIGALTVGISGLVPAIVGAVGAIKLGFDGLKDGAKAYMAQFDDMNAVTAATIGNLMGPMLTAWQEVSTRIKLDFAQNMVPAFNNFGALLRELEPQITGINRAFASTAGAISAQLLAAAPQIQTILEGSKQFIEGITPGLQQLTKGILDITASAQKAMPDIAAAVSGAMTKVGAAFSQVAASPEFQQAQQGFAMIITSIGNLIAGLIPVFAQVGAMLGPLFAQFVNVLGPALNQVILAFAQIGQTVGPFFIQFIAALGPLLANLVRDFGTLATAVGPYIVPLFTALGAAIHQITPGLAALGTTLTQALTNVLPQVATVINALMIPIAQLMPTFGTLLKAIGEIVMALSPALLALAGAVGQVAQGLVTGLQPLIPVFNQLAVALAPIITQLGSTVAAVLTDLGPTLARVIADVSQVLLPILPGAIETIGRFLEACAKLLDLLTSIPGLVQAVTFAFVAWESIKGIDFLITSLGALVVKLGLVAPAAEVAAAGTEAAMAGAGAATTGAIAAMAPFAAVAAGVVAGIAEIGYAVKQLWDQLQGRPTGKQDWAHLLLGKAGDLITGGGGGGPPAPPPGAPAAPAAPPPTPLPPEFQPPVSRAAPELPNQPGYGPPPPAPPGAVPQKWAPPGPSTPVAPELKKGAEPPKPPQPPELPLTEQPIQNLIQTPEQLTLLTQIRDLLAGTGNQDAPLNSLKDLKPAVQRIAQDLKKTLPESKLPPGAIPGHMGPFGTPIPAFDPGYQAAYGFLQGLGEKHPEQIIGINPIDYANQQWQGQVDAMTTTMNYQIDQWQQSADMQAKWNDYLQKLATWQQKNGGAPGVPGIPTAAGAPMGGLNWGALAQAEASGNWASRAEPSGTYFGGLQFDLPTWNQYKPPGAPPNPADATQEQQIQAANNAMAQGRTPQSLWPTNWQQLYAGTNIPPGAVPPPAAPGLPPGMPTAPGLPGPNLATAGAPIPVWVVGWGQMPVTGLPGVQPTGPLAAGLGYTPTGPLAAGLGYTPQGPLAAGLGYAPGMPQNVPTQAYAGALKDTGAVPTIPQGQYVANLLYQLFGLTSTGSRPAGTAAQNTHEVGRAIDVPIANPALGDQVNTWLQQNAQQLGIQYTIWRDIGRNALGGGSGGPGSTFNVPGHQDHIDVQFTGGPPGMSPMMPFGPTAPGLPGANIGTSGSPVPVFVTNWPGQQQQMLTPGQAMAAISAPVVGAGIKAAGDVAANVTGDVLDAIGNVPLPGLKPGTLTQPAADLGQLIHERNPLAVASAVGLTVPSFAMAGGTPGAQAAVAPTPGFDASGRMFSDTSALIDRTMSSLAAQIEAMRQQLLDVLNQIKDRLTDQVLKPIVKAAVSEALNSISDTTMNRLGGGIGTAAAPPIADAVASAVPSSPAPTGVGQATGGVDQIFQGIGDIAAAQLFDEGGNWPTGTVGLNLSGQTERVLSPSETALWNTAIGSGVFATQAGVFGEATVGAEWFGASQIPILGALISMIVQIVMMLVGIQVQVRDTLNELTDQFRLFRGDAFKAFDAQGRLLNDTSGLIDRSLSSEQAVVDERVRILKMVIDALVQYIIEKIVIPITKAVGEALVDALAAAVSSAASSSGMPGAAVGGAAAGALISSAGHAAIEIGAQIWTDATKAITPVLVQSIGEGIQTAFPQAVNQIFSRGLLQGLGGGAGAAFGGTIGTLAAIFGTGRGGGMFGSITGFDSGGKASGPGLMPKAIIEPEMVLGPRDTANFERLVDILDRGSLGGRTVTIHAPFTVTGDARGGEQARDRLLALLS